MNPPPTILLLLGVLLALGSTLPGRTGKAFRIALALLCIAALVWIVVR
jgi:hypothetical protein